VGGGVGRGIKYSTRTKRERGSHMPVPVSLGLIETCDCVCVLARYAYYTENNG
jgi:hypothetical protein